MIEAVIFDLDGTLIQIPINYEALFQEFKKIMKTDKIRPLTKTISKLGEKKRKEVFKVWDKFELLTLTEAKKISMGSVIYDEFSKKRKALVTMQGKVFVQNILKRFNWLFDYIITREDSLDRSKQLTIAVKKLNTQFQNVLFVGNTEEDDLHARKVGCKFLKV
jgi:HAD superfamily hydrolase (TIGR01549 family)